MERYFSSLLVFVYYNFNTFFSCVTMFYTQFVCFSMSRLSVYWAAVSALLSLAVPPKCSTCQLYDQLVHLGNKLID